MKKLLLVALMAFVLAAFLAFSVFADEVLDPKSTAITVTVDTGAGEESVSVLTGNVYSFNGSSQITGVNATFTSVDGVEYSKNDLVKAIVPAGITLLKQGAFNGLSKLKEIELLDGANLTFEYRSLQNCAKLERVTVGECNVVFNMGVAYSCNSFATLDVSRANATFKEKAFQGYTAIKHLVMGSGNTYDFGGYAFQNSGLTEVVFPDYSNIKVYQKSFAETKTIEYVYVGYECFKSSNNAIGDDNQNYSVFGGNGKLSKVVLMDVTYIGKWVFSTKKTGDYRPFCDLTVYSHSETLALNTVDLTFNDRNTNGFKVYLYTADADMSSTLGTTSNYVVYMGIGHAYTLEHVSDSTCSVQGVSKYVTDCPCGIGYFENGYTSISNFNAALNNVSYPALGGEEVYSSLLPHTLGDTVASIDYKNGMAQKGYQVYSCEICGAFEAEEEASLEALFTDLGFSFSTYSTKSISRSIRINRDAYSAYCEITGKTVEFGVAVALEELVQDGKLIDSQGDVVSEYVLAYSCTDSVNSVFEMRVVDVDGFEDASIFCVGYYVLDGVAYYVEGEGSNIQATSVTYSELI